MAQSLYNAKPGATKRCLLSWLTNSALLYEPKCGGGGELRGLSQWVQLYTRAQINFRDLTPIWTYPHNRYLIWRMASELLLGGAAVPRGAAANLQRPFCAGGSGRRCAGAGRPPHRQAGHLQAFLVQIIHMSQSRNSVILCTCVMCLTLRSSCHL